MKILLAAAALAILCSAAGPVRAEYFMTFGGAAEADDLGRIKVKFPASGLSGDPDRPIIVGSVPSAPGGRVNQSDLEFVVERASRASPKLMEACANGKVFPSIDIETPGARYTLYNASLVEVRAGAVRVRRGEPASPAALRTLRSDPVVRLAYQCAEWSGRRTGEKSPACPQAAKAQGDITIKGKKILEN